MEVMDSVEKEGKTVEEAVELALRELGLGRDEVNVEVLSEPNKGFLGMVGSRLAKVRVTADSSLLHPRSILSELLRLMKIEGTIEEIETEDGFELKVESPDSALLIGKKGKNLNAIQYLVNRMYNHRRLKRHRIVIDIESYLERRKESLEDLAKHVAEKVRKTGRQEKLEALNPQDRRSIHLALQNDPTVRTFSIGSGAYRNVVIAPADEQDDYKKKQHE
jgi:spoIIIJ-associated protein